MKHLEKGKDRMNLCIFEKNSVFWRGFTAAIESFENNGQLLIFSHDLLLPIMK